MAVLTRESGASHKKYDRRHTQGFSFFNLSIMPQIDSLAFDQMIPFSFWAGGHEDNHARDRKAENSILPHTIEADYHCGESGCSIEWDWWTLG